MQDMRKTKAQLVEELEQFRNQVAWLTTQNLKLDKAEKAAMDAYEESEKKFRALTESTTAHIIMAQEDRFLYANKAALEHYGLTWEELSVRKLNEVFIKDEAQKAESEAFVKEVIQGGATKVHHEFYEVYKDGSKKWFEAHGSQLPIDGKPAWIWTQFDITERKQAQESIEQSERKFRSLAESTTAHISIVQDNRHVYANQAFLDYFGVDRQDLSRISPEDLMMGVMGPEAIAKASTAWKKALERGDARLRFEYQDLEGNWFQMNVTMMQLDSKPAFMGMAFDITELKQAQQKIEENEKRYRTIFDTAGTGMISFGADGVITLANEEWVKLSGYSIDETVGKLTWERFFTEQSRETIQKVQRVHVRKPARVPQAHEAHFIDRAGRIHEGIINIQTIPGTQQKVASFQDMTELKRVQNEMYRADKMAALGQIIAGVAHEINNPNNFIYFNLPILRRYIEAIAPLLASRLEKEPDLKILGMSYEVFLKDVFKLLDNMEHGSTRITSIVSDLKNYVRSDEDQDWKIEHIDQAVERVMTLVGKQVRKMVKRFEVEVADGLAPVRMNAGKIEQVLINLLINAGHAADKEDSFIKVSARSAVDVEGWVELRVEDNGTGIEEDNLKQIFEPFFTSKGSEQGTGLGLPISQRIIEEHGGRISVESKFGQGTCFSVLLPTAHTS